MLKGKARRAQNWLPTQVLYGVDCSDPDPEKWVSFGSEVDAAAASRASKASPLGVKASQPGQSAPAGT